MSNHLISDDWIAAALEKAKMKEYFPGLVGTKLALNPCIKVFGDGPEGKKCKTCELLRRTGRNKTYLKCSLRPMTNGPGTDHKAGWPACSRYREEPKILAVAATLGVKIESLP